MPSAVLPGSIKIGNYTDNGFGQLKSGDNIVNADYAYGRLSGLPTGYYTVTAVPGAKSSSARYALAVEIKETNHGTSFAPLLRPNPALGSLKVSFMALGVWYVLTDTGDGVLRDEAGKSVGTVSSATGSVLLNLPSLPDVGSRLVFQWGDSSGFTSFDGGKTGGNNLPKAANGKCTYSLGHSIKPGTLVLTWQNNGKKRAQDDGAGKLTGDATGNVDYLNGTIKLPAYIDSTSVDYVCDEPDRIQVGLADGRGLTAAEKGEVWNITLGTAVPDWRTVSLTALGSFEEYTSTTVSNSYSGYAAALR